MLGDAPSLVEVIGAAIRENRQELEVTLEEVADCAQRYGLTWGRASVAQLETGKRGLSAHELAVLPFVLSCAFRSTFTLADLLGSAPAVQLFAGTHARISGEQLLLLLGGRLTGEGDLVSPVPVGAIERRVAQDLGEEADLDVFAQWTYEHLGERTSREERDRRVRKLDPRADKARQQALRGRVTRELRVELAEAWKAAHGAR